MKLTSILLLLAICSASAAQGKKVVQINITGLMNARPVTTLKKGKLTTWTKGIDGGGLADGYLTQSAAAFVGDKEAHSLPDEALIKGNVRHPDILLHYDNSDDKNAQARSVSGSGEFVIKTPANHYSKVYLALSSAEGSSSLELELIYTDGKEITHYLLQDYYNNVPQEDSNFTYLLTDLAKWGRNNNMTEKDHHNIHLLKLNIDPTKELVGIRLKKSKEGYLVFWSATGVLN